VPVLKAETHLPVIVDPSHAAGRADIVGPLACAAVAVGADGLIIEVHPDPSTAKSDGPQSLTIPAFERVMESIKRYALAAERDLLEPGRPTSERVLGANRWPEVTNAC